MLDVPAKSNGKREHARKLPLDWCGQIRLLSALMDEDTRELIRRLCTKTGMIMEDASAIAALAPQEEHVSKLRRAAERIVILLAAAQVLRDG